MADPSLQDTQQNIRIPLVNVGDSRLSGDSVGYYWDQMFLNCFPLVASHPVTGESELTVSKRPGISSTPLSMGPITVGDAVVPLAFMGMTQLSDVCIAAFFEPTTAVISIIQFQPFANTWTRIGTIPSADYRDKIYLTEIMLTTTQVPGLAVTWCKYDFTTSAGYYAQSGGVNFAAFTLTKITDVLYPANVANEVLVGPMQQLNQYFYAMGRSGKIYQCGNPLNIVAWSSRIIETYSYPDKGVGIFRFKHHLVAFSDTTIEFFNDTGARGDASTISSSLERTEQAFIKFGAISAKYVKNVDDILYWASSSDTTTTGVWKMEGYTPVKISTYKQDQILNLSIINDTDRIGSLESMSMLGQKHILLNVVHANMLPFSQTSLTSYPAVDDPYWSVNDFSIGLQPSQMCYCLETKCWWHFSDCSEMNGFVTQAILPCSYFNRAQSNSYSTQYFLKVSQVTVLGINSSYIWTLSADSPGYIDLDVGETVSVNNPKHSVLSCIQTNTLDQGTLLRKYLRKLNLVMDTPRLQDTQRNLEPYIYLSMERDDSQGMYLPSNQKIFPVKQRTLSPYAFSTDIGTFSFNYSTFIQPSTQMTLEGWFFIGSSDFTANGTTSFPIQSWKSDNTSSSWAVAFGRVDPNYVLSLNIATTASDTIGLHNLVYQTPKTNSEWVGWHHWSIQIDLSLVGNAKALLKIDEVATAWTGGTGLTATSFITSSDKVTIGARQAGAGTSTSSISMSNARIWNGVRSDEELTYYKNDQTLVTGVTNNLLYNHLDGTDMGIYNNQTPTGQQVFIGTRTSDILPKPIFTATYVNNCGLISRTAFNILHKAPISFRAKALELNLVQGSR